MVRKYVSSSVLLVIATIAALIIANSPIGNYYREFWELPVSVSIGGFNIFNHNGQPMPLGAFINDFLMAIFFLTVGLEIKRELLVGELSSVKKALDTRDCLLPGLSQRPSHGARHGNPHGNRHRLLIGLPEHLL